MFLIVYLSIKTCFLTNLNTDLYHVRGAPLKKNFFFIQSKSIEWKSQQLPGEKKMTRWETHLVVLFLKKKSGRGHRLLGAGLILIHIRWFNE